MPIYEYRCQDCRGELEAQQSFSDDPLTECPTCGGKLKKKFSSVGISFKGSGFYKTDSRGSGPAKAKEPAAKESSDSSASSGSSESSGSKSSDSPAATSSSSDSAKKSTGGDSGPSKTAAATPA
jgi:putative FmdB family regulatory protein